MYKCIAHRKLEKSSEAKEKPGAQIQGGIPELKSMPSIFFIFFIQLHQVLAAGTAPLSPLHPHPSLGLALSHTWGLGRGLHEGESPGGASGFLGWR